MRGKVSGLGTVRVERRCAGRWEGWRVIEDCF